MLYYYALFDSYTVNEDLQSEKKSPSEPKVRLSTACNMTALSALSLFQLPHAPPVLCRTVGWDGHMGQVM